MSKGFGAVQHKIAKVLAENTDDAFRVDELCREVFGEHLVEKKQRVSVIRAAKSVSEETSRPFLDGFQRTGDGACVLSPSKCHVLCQGEA